SCCASAARRRASPSARLIARLERRAACNRPVGLDVLNIEARSGGRTLRRRGRYRANRVALRGEWSPTMNKTLITGLASAMALSTVVPAAAQYGTPYRPTPQYQQDLRDYQLQQDQYRYQQA